MNNESTTSIHDPPLKQWPNTSKVVTTKASANRKDQRGKLATWWQHTATSTLFSHVHSWQRRLKIDNALVIKKSYW